MPDLIDDPLQNAQPPANATPTDPTPAPGLSAAEVQTMMDSTLAPHLATIETQRAENQALRDQLAQQTATPAPTPDPPNNDVYMERLTADTQGTIEATSRDVARAEMSGVVNERVVPLLDQVAQIAHTAILERQIARIDQEYGAGAWKETFDGPMADRIRQMAPADSGNLINPNWMDDQVNILVGQNAENLLTHRTTTQEATMKAETDKLQEQIATYGNTVNLNGGVRTAPRSDSNRPLDAGEQEYESLAAAQGITVDAKSLRKMSGVKTIDDYRAATAGGN